MMNIGSEIADHRMYPNLWQRQMIYQQQIMAIRNQYQPGNVAANFWQAQSPVKISPDLPGKPKLELDNRKLWKKFNDETTEMIITKSGRRMFPSMQVSVTGLDPKARYSVILELVEASDRRHKYVGNASEVGTKSGARGWIVAGPAEPQPGLERRRYIHPDGPALGSHWMQHPISFSKLKLTNNAMDHHPNVLLTSMHKYVPRIWIIRCDEGASAWDYFNNPASCFVFQETEFIAVTAYQNENITKLKINNNPFAKGFRETGQSSCKRKRQSSEESSEAPSSASSSASSCSASSHEDPNSSANESYDSDLENGPANKRVRPDTQEPAQDQPKPKLHRPWADEEEEPNRLAPEVYKRPETAPDEPLNLQANSFLQDYYRAHYYSLVQQYLRPEYHTAIDNYKVEFTALQHIPYYPPCEED